LFSKNASKETLRAQDCQEPPRGERRRYAFWHIDGSDNKAQGFVVHGFGNFRLGNGQAPGSPL